MEEVQAIMEALGSDALDMIPKYKWMSQPIGLAVLGDHADDVNDVNGVFNHTDDPVYG